MTGPILTTAEIEREATVEGVIAALVEQREARRAARRAEKAAIREAAARIAQAQGTPPPSA